MATVGGSLEYVSEILGDQQKGREYRVFTKKFLQEAMDEALSVIASDLPDLLAREVEFVLKEGELQDSPCPGGTIKPLTGSAKEMNADNIANATASHMFGGCAGGGYELQYYANIEGGNHVRVNPPVPKSKVGTKMKVLCKGTVPPDFDSSDDDYDMSWMPPDAKQIIHDWMLYRSFLTDDQDIHTNAEADRIYNRLTRRLGTERMLALQERDYKDSQRNK